MECFDEPKLYVGCQICVNPLKADLVSRAEGGRWSGYHEYAGRSADEQKKSRGLIARPALQGRPRQNAFRSARTNLIAPWWGRKDADRKIGGPRCLLGNGHRGRRPRTAGWRRRSPTMSGVATPGDRSR